MRNDTLFFPIAGIDIAKATLQFDRAQNFFQGHNPICLLCPTKALSEYVHSRFIEAGRTRVHLNLDSTPGKMSVAVFLEVQLHVETVLLPSDYEMLSAIARSTLKPSRVGIRRVIFGNGYDLDFVTFQSLQAEHAAKGALAVVIGSVAMPPYYALPDSAVLFKVREFSQEAHSLFMLRVRRFAL